MLNYTNKLYFFKINAPDKVINNNSRPRAESCVNLAPAFSLRDQLVTPNTKTLVAFSYERPNFLNSLKYLIVLCFQRFP